MVSVKHSGLGEALADLNGPGLCVYTSTYRRVIDTAAVAFPCLPAVWPQQTHLLDEQHYGDATYMTKTELFATYPDCVADRHMRKHLWVPPGGGESRGSPQTVETSVVVIMASMAGLLAPVPGRGQAWPARLFLVPGAAVVSGVKGGPQGRRAPARCGAPLRPEGRPRTLSGREKASGGAAASFSRPAQRARRAHAASFPARDRS